MLISLLACGAAASGRSKKPAPELTPQDIVMDGGRKLTFERTFSTEREVKIKRGFWTKVLDVVAGEPDYHVMVRPYAIAVDSRGRVIVTDPGAQGIHIFDFAEQKYKFIQRQEKKKDSMLAPQCVAIDAQNNLYVTDSESGKIFIFDANGKYQRALGSLPGGEGYFKRPTGIAVDSEEQRIYVTDTLRNKVFVLDMKGAVLQTIGERGAAEGQFNFPTELLLDPEGFAVVDAMNFRVQTFDRSGGLQEIQRATSILRTLYKVRCRFSIVTDSSYTFLVVPEQASANFNCLRDWQSTTMIESTSSILTIGGYRYSIILERPNTPRG
jgi:hypothetical protein